MSEASGQIIQQQFLALITQFYCSLAGKKDMQNVSTEIREFVLMRNDIKNKQQTAKRILDFFLNLESHLIGKSEQDWDRSFELFTARGYALLKICEFPSKNAQSYAFRRLILQERPANSHSHTILMNIQSPEDEINIEVEQEIRQKTYYFFKWCQFVDHCKALKQIKKRQIHNRKISLSFNKFGVKSTYFSLWKALWKRTKLESQKSKIIEANRKRRVQETHLRIIEEVAAILSVEWGLSSKIGQKIIHLRKREVFKKLKTNRSIIRGLTAKYKTLTNSIAYLFIRHFSTKLKPLMNKSFQASRAKLGKDAATSLASKYFKCFKEASAVTHQRISTLLQSRKKMFLNTWKLLLRKGANFVSQSRTLQNFLTSRRRKSTIARLSFNKFLRHEQYNKIEALVGDFSIYLSKSSLIQMSVKRQVKSKQTLISNIQVQKRMHSFYQALRKCKRSSKERLDIKKKLHQIIIKNFKQRHSQMKLKLEEHFEYYQKLRERHEDVIKASSFKKWKKLKICKKNQESAIGTMNRLSKNVIIKIFWNKLTFRTTEKIRLQKFILQYEFILKKLAFSKLSKRSLFINQEVGKMVGKSRKKLMHNLFILLKANQQYNTILSQNIHKFYVKRSQKLLIQSLKQLKSKTSKNDQLSLHLQKSKCKSFLIELKRRVDLENLLKSKCSLVSEKTFLIYFYKSVTADLVTKQKMSKKTEDLETKLQVLGKLNFLQTWKKCFKQQSSIEYKLSKIKQRFLSHRLIKIKEYIRLVKRIALQQMKAKQILSQRTLASLRILMLDRRQRTLSQFFNFRQKHRKIVDAIELREKKMKINNNLSKFYAIYGGKLKKQFFEYLRIDKKIAQEKDSRLSTMQAGKIMKKINVLFALLWEQKQYAEGKAKLIQSRRRIFLSQFMANSLRYKFNKIKFNTSLKFYARNILNKAFRSLKHAHVKGKQKENMIKLDRTSSIMVEKSIEKSFKSNTLSEQIEKFNLRKSRLIR